MSTRKAKFIVLTLILVLMFVGIFSANSVNAAQNSSYPSPTQCDGADWNIGTPDGVTCSASVTTYGALEQNSRATSIFGAASRLHPDLTSLNTFCKAYTGDNTSYATYGRMHNYCNGCDQKLSWWSGSSWTTTTACAGTLNVQLVTCGTGCGATCSTHSTKQCSNNSVYWYNSCGVKEDLYQACTSNQVCQNGQCIDQRITCSASSDCGTSGYTGNEYCNNGDVYQNYTTYTCNNAGTANSYCSNATAAKLKTNCTTGQTCSNGSCVNQNITCSSTADCGASGYIGDAFCSDGDVYKTFKSYNCNNAGTSSSYCSSTTVDKLITNCSTNQTCSNGKCSTIACSSSSDCGTSGYTGSEYCSGGNVYQNYNTYKCNNAGTSSSYCSNSSSARLKQTCTSSQTCSNGSCTDQQITCSTSSDCGTSGYIGDAFCSGGDVYKTYRTYRCNNAGTANSSCSSSTDDKLVTNCSSTQTCSNGSCQNEDIACDSSSDCGTSGYIGDAFCSGGDVYKTYRTYRCNNAGTSSSYCSNSSSDKLITDCSNGQTCSNGSCDSSCTDYSYKQCSGNYLYWYDSCGNRKNLVQYCSNGCYNNSCNYSENLSVTTNSATSINNNQATLNGYVYGNNNYNGSAYYSNYVWFQWGTSASYGNETSHQTLYSSGSFSQIINLNSYNTTYHYRAVAQNSNGNIVYGNDMTFVPGNTNTNTLNITKTVKNLSNGNSNFSTTAYASPSDVVMFMITIQAYGNQDIYNAYVRDVLPANLIYKNNLIVSGSSNYSGDITSGMNFGTISAGQTITITYQAQVASASNFSYGTTTLNNSVSVTSSNSSYNPTSNASVIVTRSAVYGISTISTGLTNNFLTDSFLLPLIIALGGMWMFKAGMFGGVEKWINNRTKKNKEYLAEKKLNSKIAQIKELEKTNN